MQKEDQEYLSVVREILGVDSDEEIIESDGIVPTEDIGKKTYENNKYNNMDFNDISSSIYSEYRGNNIIFTNENNNKISNPQNNNILKGKNNIIKY